jgi:hypothetical protein
MNYFRMMYCWPTKYLTLYNAKPRMLTGIYRVLGISVLLFFYFFRGKFFKRNCFFIGIRIFAR